MHEKQEKEKFQFNSHQTWNFHGYSQVRDKKKELEVSWFLICIYIDNPFGGNIKDWE